MSHRLGPEICYQKHGALDTFDLLVKAAKARDATCFAAAFEQFRVSIIVDIQDAVLAGNVLLIKIRENVWIAVKMQRRKEKKTEEEEGFPEEKESVVAQFVVL
jgi:hypothetical protein